MRVIAGSARGRRLRAPRGPGTRPMLDRHKESLFNVLAGRLEGGVLDLFAGSGSLGIEALSRGAAQAVFVERSPRAVEALRANLARCGLQDRSRILVHDAFRLDPGLVGGPLGVVFLDPPFALARAAAGRVLELAARVAREGALLPGAMFVLRVPRGCGLPPWPDALAPADRRDAGEGVILLLHASRKGGGNPAPGRTFPVQPGPPPDR